MIRLHQFVQVFPEAIDMSLRERLRDFHNMKDYSGDIKETSHQSGDYITRSTVSQINFGKNQEDKEFFVFMARYLNDYWKRYSDKTGLLFDSLIDDDRRYLYYEELYLQRSGPGFGWPLGFDANFPACNRFISFVGNINESDCFKMRFQFYGNGVSEQVVAPGDLVVFPSNMMFPYYIDDCQRELFLLKGSYTWLNQFQLTPPLEKQQTE